ncbi:MAG: hypothetical protein A3B13_00790 [Candidatus Liptonbacteria bacterium RIFCSPLOWO2_01_FULL_45_15]|uniref:Uncharacterized protein n=1 Tax=Candidatus Liptonbacteria bacterium RIFCSPLOWO2_01_FULL_45_15 TaxID=1798649 RepID=A0A1G2CH78_9BACT|nr:MAG: hypothetical protein A3B13_00790 [Candidatus Liptonbacteria bacterium RIFCSPLOWO2_01_FULL_45_15]
MRTKFLWENTVKHIIVVVLLYLTYGYVKDFFAILATDNIGHQSVIVLSSMLLMAFLFASYTFSFKDSDMRHSLQRFLDHINTAIVIFGCGVLLEISYVAINSQLHQSFTIMGWLMILFYISLVMFDFWDLMRGIRQHENKFD